LRGFANKTAIIPFGINTTALKPNQEKVAEIRNRYRGKKIIYSLGRLVYYKGYDYLIEAAGRLSDDYVVIIGGDGPLSEKLKTTIAEKELSQKVVMPGSIRGADIGSYYEACDIFCLPSTERSEAFGIVLVEAMSFGKPLITTNIPTGVSWVNQHEQTGLLVKPKDAAALSQAIEKIAANQELYSLLSGNCRKRYSALFSQDKMIDAIIKLYTDLNRPK
ncbi:MAG: glycosyltransferase, partial [Candidatus Magnetominusculus sp. LBB02]|nr:glycosyltransferase [Candidatus Magnetominusculus sp. LBB02]